MALEGSLGDFGLADILQLIYFQKKSGILTLSGKRDSIQLSFSDGNVVSVESFKGLGEERTGRVLIKKGLIRDDDLQACLDEQKTTGAKIGNILFKRGLVAKKDIEETLTSQMTETVVQLFSWKEGTYEFKSQAVRVDGEIPITLDTQHLLMEGLRIVDEWSLVEGKVTLDTVFRKTGKSVAGLRHEEKEILKFVDGESEVSIIIDLSGASDFEASRTLVLLMERGIIEPVDVAPVIGKAPVAPEAKTERGFARFLLRLVFIAAVAASLVAAGFQFRGSAVLLSGDSLNRIKAAKDVEELRFSAELFRYKNGYYPLDLRELGKKNDPWGRPYLYRIEDESPVIASAGPDGKIGTADDVY